MKLFILSLLMFAGVNAMAQNSDNNKQHSILHYIYSAPKVKTAHPPVIILLHGIGTDEHDLFSLADHLPDNFLIVSARAPYEIRPGGYAWYAMDLSSGKPIINEEQAEKSRKTILEFIDQLQQTYHFDSKQVYLCGFSQGAIMSYSVGLTHPEKVKGISILSGRLLDQVKPQIAANEQLKRLKVFIAHGTADNVLSPQYAKDAESYLLTKDIKPVVKTYLMGHSITTDEINDLVHWLR